MIAPPTWYFLLILRVVLGAAALALSWCLQAMEPLKRGQIPLAVVACAVAVLAFSLALGRAIRSFLSVLNGN